MNIVFHLRKQYAQHTAHLLWMFYVKRPKWPTNFFLFTLVRISAATWNFQLSHTTTKSICQKPKSQGNQKCYK